METQNTNLYYQPKGSMCIVCKHRDQNCSDLPFHKMKKLEQQHCRIIVKCSEFERESEE